MEQAKISILFPDSVAKYQTRTEMIVNRKAKNKNIVQTQINESIGCFLRESKAASEHNHRSNQGIHTQSDNDKISEAFSYCKTRSELLALRKELFVKANDDIANFSFKNSDERLNEREKRNCATPNPGNTRTQIHQERKVKDFNHLIETFGKQSLGIHKDLPKFSENFQEYWRKDIKRDHDCSCSPEKTIEVSYFKRIPNRNISVSPHRLHFNKEFYLEHSIFARKRDWNLGPITDPKPAKPSRLKTSVSTSRKKVYTYEITSDIPPNAIRSSGFSIK